MSEYYDQFHRWEPLAEFHFNSSHDETTYHEDDYVVCVCSRAFIKDGVKTYYVEKEDGSETDGEFEDTRVHQWDDQSHVHFSLDTSYKVKCEKDENASCYCSATHTDNYCSTDEHDPAQNYSNSHGLQTSDSGADLTYPDCHSNYIKHKLETIDSDTPTVPEANEQYLSESTWDKFWAINGERLIWASWIKKYSDYINPNYFDENSQDQMDGNVPKKQHSFDQIYKEVNQDDGEFRERKFSYDSKVNPFKKGWSKQNSADKAYNCEKDSKDNVFVPIGRRRSCSEHDRVTSPRTLAGTDSMTNVTKMTLSSYNASSSRVTSESSPTDDYSLSSSSSDDPSNDQTRIANVNESAGQIPSEEQDSDDYWQFLWKKHFGEQYAWHYANYIETHESQKSQINSRQGVIEAVSEEKLQVKGTDIECEESEGSSQEKASIDGNGVKMASINENQKQLKCDDKDEKIVKEKLNIEETEHKNRTEVDSKTIQTVSEKQDSEAQEIKSEDKVTQNKRRNKKSNRSNNKYLGSLTYLLQNLLKEEQTTESSEPNDAGGADNGRTQQSTSKVVDVTADTSNIQEPNVGDKILEEKLNTNVEETEHKDSSEVDSKTMLTGSEKENSKDKHSENKLNKKSNSSNSRYLGSITYLLQNLHKEEQTTGSSEPYDAGDADSGRTQSTSEAVDVNTDRSTIQESGAKRNIRLYTHTEEDDDDDPPPEKSINLKRCHELDEDEDEDSSEKIISTFEIMGFNLDEDNLPVGQMIYRKPNKRLRPPRSKRFGEPKKTYFDDDGNSYPADQQSQDSEEREFQTDDDSIEVKDESVLEKEIPIDPSKVLFSAGTSFSDFQDESDSKPFEGVVGNIVKRKRRQKRYKVDEDGIIISDMPPELEEDPKMRKYWKKRHSLFHRFDEGIKLDKESWFSVTPENVAWHIANKCAYDVVLDAFCGAGGNTIQFAKVCKKVIAIDIDPAKIEMARHNATVYGVADWIEFIVGDFFELAPTIEADMVFLSPPWGGPDYTENKHYDIESQLQPRPASELVRAAREISSNVSLYLPRNTRTDQILSLAMEAGGSVEIEQNYLDRRFVAITAYFY